jgi:hypothetical protein
MPGDMNSANLLTLSTTGVSVGMALAAGAIANPAKAPKKWRRFTFF